MMKPYSKQTHYEILAVPIGASPFEIKRAYQEAFELYRDDSMAAYSFFSDAERKEILSRLEEAYITLINSESRSGYDYTLTEMGIIEEGKQYRDLASGPISIFNLERQTTHYQRLPEYPLREKSLVSENAFIQDILKRDRLTGQDLKSIRTTLGVLLERISLQTKVPLGTLQAIEDDRFDRLPPPVYLKSFLKMYAQCLQIEASVIVQGYMNHYENGK